MHTTFHRLGFDKSLCNDPLVGLYHGGCRQRTGHIGRNLTDLPIHRLENLCHKAMIVSNHLGGQSGLL